MEQEIKKYQTILLDPPWEYTQKFSGGSKKCNPGKSASCFKYPTLSLEKLKEIKLLEFSNVNSHYYIWTTNNLFSRTLSLIEDWGLQYRQILVWVKLNKNNKQPVFGMGKYFRNSCEFLIFCTRKGIVSLTNTKNMRSVFFAERRRHFEKPQIQYEIIEKQSNEPYLEMFARNKKENWDVWGDEVKSDIEIKMER